MWGLIVFIPFGIMYITLIFNIKYTVYFYGNVVSHILYILWKWLFFDKFYLVSLSILSSWAYKMCCIFSVEELLIVFMHVLYFFVNTSATIIHIELNVLYVNWNQNSVFIMYILFYVIFFVLSTTNKNAGESIFCYKYPLTPQVIVFWNTPKYFFKKKHRLLVMQPSLHYI